MTGDLGFYTAMLVMAAVTLFTRLVGSEVMRYVPVSRPVERFLEALSSAVIAAVVATVLAQSGPREAMAVAIAGLAVLLMRNVVAAMLTGMAAAALWTAILSP